MTVCKKVRAYFDEKPPPGRKTLVHKRDAYKYYVGIFFLKQQNYDKSFYYLIRYGKRAWNNFSGGYVFLPT